VITANKAYCLPRPIRVCFLIDRLASAGTESQLLGLISRLDRRRVEPLLCLLDGQAAESRALEPTCCPVKRWGVQSILRLGTARKMVEFARWLRAMRVDLLQVHFPDSTYFGVLAARLARIPVIRTRRNVGHWLTRRDRLLGRLANRLTLYTIANCSGARQACIEQEAAAPESVFVVPNGIELERFNAIPDLSTTWGLRPPRIGVVANLRAVKGLDVFIEAAAQVQQVRPDATFVVAGEGPERPALERLIATRRLSDHVRLLGAVNDIPGFLAGIDIAVCSSRAEGLSNSLLEYMAAGRAIVATDVGGNRELIRHCEQGLVVPHDDVPALAVALLNLLRNPQLACASASSAKRRSEMCDWPAVVQQHTQLYASAVGGRALSDLSPAAGAATARDFLWG